MGVHADAVICNIRTRIRKMRISLLYQHQHPHYFYYLDPRAYYPLYTNR
jgi:hypothetical protein